MKTAPRISVRVSRSITEIAKEDWESVFPSIAESYDFFKTIDETLSGQFKSFYISLSDGPRVLCVAPCFAMDYPLDTTVEGFLKKIMSWFQHRVPKMLTLRVLICGCQAAEGRIGISDKDCPDIALALSRAMDAVAKREKAHIISFKDFSREYDSFFKPLLKNGFHKMQGYPSVELDISFSSFDGYLESLSKATRKSLKRKFKEVEELPKIELEVRAELGGLLDEAYGLYLETLHKSEVQFEQLTKEFFRNISKNMPGETKYFLWRIGGKLVAFDLCLVAGGTLVDEYIGMDYDFAYKYHLYYVTYRDILSWCIQNRIRTYESGALNYDPKKRLDLKFIPQYIYVKHGNAIMNFLLGLLCYLLKPENFDPVLKAMKKESWK